MIKIMILLTLVGCAGQSLPECEYPSRAVNDYRTCLRSGGENCEDTIAEAYGCYPVIPESGLACYQSIEGTDCTGAQ